MTIPISTIASGQQAATGGINLTTLAPVAAPTSQTPAPAPAPAPKPAPATAAPSAMAAYFVGSNGLVQLGTPDAAPAGPPPPVPASTINDQLNAGQAAAFDNNQSNPLNNDQDLTDAKASAQSLIDNATANIGGLQDQLAAATTGANDLRTQTQGYYDKLGISGLQDDVATAQKALSDVQLSEKSNKFNLEDEYTGTGATEGFTDTVDNRDQRVLSIKELAASTQLAVAQQRLSSQIDVFKTFTDQADKQQSDTIQQLSTQLSLNKADLSAGVQLLNQARLQEHGDEVAARQLVLTLATQVPGLFQQLTPTDQQNISQGKITPTILAAMGNITLAQQQKLNIAQQNANVGLSNAFGQAYGLSQFGGPANGTATVSGQRLDIARQKALGGGSFDAAATAQDMANQVSSLQLIPASLQGYFEQKVDSSGKTYLVPKVAAGQRTSFASAYATYWKANSKASYQPNQQPQASYVFDPNQVTQKIQEAIAAGSSYTQIRASFQSDGVPLTVYNQALKNVLNTK